VPAGGAARRLPVDAPLALVKENESALPPRVLRYTRDVLRYTRDVLRYTRDVLRAAAQTDAACECHRVLPADGPAPRA
jgi:hypothetical protein